MFAKIFHEENVTELKDVLKHVYVDMQSIFIFKSSEDDKPDHYYNWGYGKYRYELSSLYLDGFTWEDEKVYAKILREDYIFSHQFEKMKPILNLDLEKMELDECLLLILQNYHLLQNSK